MYAGIFIPSGIGGEFRGWEPARAWARILDLARLADEAGFESIRVADHLQNISQHDEAPTFEAFTVLTAVALATERVRLGPGVACTSFRNPAFLAKMMTTLDVASGGRAEIGLGAGWNEWEWRGYGYGFPPVAERLRHLRESLEVITRMLAPGRATFAGELVRVEGAICEPKGLQAAIPVIVGGNGQNVTWRLAVKFAGELNLDGPSVDDVERWMPLIRQRCEEAGRDPATLRVSALALRSVPAGAQRVEALQRLASLGLYRVHSDFNTAGSDEPLLAFAADCRAAGIEMAG